jgi:hypothetical protein
MSYFKRTMILLFACAVGASVCSAEESQEPGPSRVARPAPPDEPDPEPKSETPPKNENKDGARTRGEQDRSKENNVGPRNVDEKQKTPERARERAETVREYQARREAADAQAAIPEPQPGSRAVIARPGDDRFERDREQQQVVLRNEQARRAEASPRRAERVERDQEQQRAFQESQAERRD